MPPSHVFFVQSFDGIRRVAAALEERGCRVTTAITATNAVATLPAGEFDCLGSVFEVDGPLPVWNAVHLGWGPT